MTINKDALYGQNTKSWDRHQALQEHVTRKALDLPEDMNQNIRTGMGWKELLVIGGLVIGGGYLVSQATMSPPDPTPAVAPAEDRDTTRRIEIEKFIPPDK